MTEPRRARHQRRFYDEHARDYDRWMRFYDPLMLGDARRRVSMPGIRDDFLEGLRHEESWAITVRLLNELSRLKAGERGGPAPG